MDEHIDPRFSLANERTYLAWIRTALALLAGGAAAAKALNFDHEIVRWLVAAPPLAAGAALAALAARRLHHYDALLREGAPLPVAPGARRLATGIAVYGVVVLVACLLD